MRLINADRLIKTIDKSLKDAHFAEWETIGYYWDDIRYTVANTIKKQETYNTWTPVKDGIPVDENANYLCKLENCKKPVICQYKEGIGFGEWVQVDSYKPFTAPDYKFRTLEDIGYYDKVLYWMKIPDVSEKNSRYDGENL